MVPSFKNDEIRPFWISNFDFFIFHSNNAHPDDYTSIYIYLLGFIVLFKINQIFQIFVHFLQSYIFDFVIYLVNLTTPNNSKQHEYIIILAIFPKTGSQLFQKALNLTFFKPVTLLESLYIGKRNRY